MKIIAGIISGGLITMIILATTIVILNAPTEYQLNNDFAKLGHESSRELLASNLTTTAMLVSFIICAIVMIILAIELFQIMRSND